MVSSAVAHRKVLRFILAWFGLKPRRKPMGYDCSPEHFSATTSHHLIIPEQCYHCPHQPSTYQHEFFECGIMPHIWQAIDSILHDANLDLTLTSIADLPSSASTATRRWSLRPEASCSPAQVRRRTLRQGSMQARKRQQRTTRPNHQTGTIEASRKWENLGSNQRKWPKTTSRGNLAGKGTRGNTQQAKEARQPGNGSAPNHPARFK